MNVNQWQTFRALRDQVNAGASPTQKPHIVTEAKSPLYRGVTCSCGWTFRTVRRQNRLAQHSKIEAAVRAHFTGVLAARKQS